MAYSFLPNGSIMEVLALLTGAFCCEDALVSAGWQKRFSFKHKVTIAFHPFHFSCWLWLEGNKYSSSINQLYAFLRHILLLSSMSSMLSKLKTWSGKVAKVQGHLQWACLRLRSTEKKSVLWKGKWNFGHSSRRLAPACASSLAVTSRCRGALWRELMFLIKVI